MDQDDVAIMLKALGDPSRLRIFNFLRSCSCAVALEENGDARPVNGPTVGDVCCSVFGLEKVSSTISFHLKELRNAGLIRMERKGQQMICAVDTDAVSKLADFFNTSPSLGSIRQAS